MYCAFTTAHALIVVALVGAAVYAIYFSRKREEGLKRE